MRIKLSLVMRTYLSLVVLALLILVTFGGKAVSEHNQQTANESKQQSIDGGLEKLLAVLHDGKLRESEPKLVLEAIQRVGEMKAAQAISALIPLLTFSQTIEAENQVGEAIVEIHLVPPGERYPAIKALSQIGQASLPALVKVIQAHDGKSLESENASYTVMVIFRDDPARAVKYLRKAAAKSSEPMASQRLSHAADKAAEIVKKLTQP